MLNIAIFSAASFTDFSLSGFFLLRIRGFALKTQLRHSYDFFAFYENKFLPLRYKDTKKNVNKSYHFVS